VTGCCEYGNKTSVSVKGEVFDWLSVLLGFWTKALLHGLHLFLVRFQVLTATSMKLTSSWDTAPCNLISRRWALIMEAVRTSETSAYFYENARHHIPKTERRVLVVNTPASYSEGLRFKSRPPYRLSWLRFYVVLLSLSRQIPEYYLKIRLWPLPTKSFPIHRYSLVTLL
jgi:hypothetical protein